MHRSGLGAGGLSPHAITLGAVLAGGNEAEGYAIEAAAGSAATPSLSCEDDTNTGFFWDASDRLAFSSDGVARWYADEDQIRNQVGSALLPSYSFTGDPNTGIMHPDDDEVGAVAAGVLRASIVAQGIRSDQAGTAANPSVFWTGDTNTGLYHSAADEVSVALGGAQAAEFTVGGLRVPDGAVGAPSYSFLNETNTGLFRNGGGGACLAAGGNANLYLLAAGPQLGTNLDCYGHTLTNPRVSITSTDTSGTEVSLASTPGSNRSSDLVHFEGVGPNFTGGAVLNLKSNDANQSFLTMDNGSGDLFSWSQAGVMTYGEGTYRTGSATGTDASDALHDFRGDVNQNGVGGYNFASFTWTHTAIGTGTKRGIYVNAPAGFTGDLIKLDVNGAEKFAVNQAGAVQAQSVIATPSYFLTDTTSGAYFVFGGGVFGSIRGQSDDGLHFVSYAVDGTMNNNWIFTNAASGALAHGNATPSATPTIKLYSDETVSVSNQEWGSITHDGEDFLLSTGPITGVGTAPTTIRQNISFAPAGTQQFSMSPQGYFRCAVERTLDSFDRWNDVGYVNAYDTVSAKVGAGSNLVSTTPSTATLVTGVNAADAEGTVTWMPVILRSRQPRAECVVGLDSVADGEFYFGYNFANDNGQAGGDEYVLIKFDKSASGNWFLVVNDGGGEDSQDSGVAATTDNTTLEIWVETDGTVHWSIDGTEITTAGITNKMTATAHYVVIQNKAEGGGARTTSVEYVELEKTKVY